MRQVERRTFTREASLAFLGGIAVTVSACGGGGGGGNDSSPTSPGGGSTAGSGDKVGDVSANHGHRAVITAAALAAGGAVQLDIAGDAGHPHRVDLPAQAVQEIRDGRSVQKDSTTTDGHMHVVTFNPQSSEEPTRY
jgi:hypothetical protein